MTSIAPTSAPGRPAAPAAPAKDLPAEHAVREFRKHVDNAEFHMSVAANSLEPDPGYAFVEPTRFGYAANWVDDGSAWIRKALDQPVEGPARDSAEAALKEVRRGRSKLVIGPAGLPFGVPVGYYTGRQGEQHIRKGIELLQQASAQAAAYDTRPDGTEPRPW